MTYRVPGAELGASPTPALGPGVTRDAPAAGVWEAELEGVEAELLGAGVGVAPADWVGSALAVGVADGVGVALGVRVGVDVGLAGLAGFGSVTWVIVVPLPPDSAWPVMSSKVVSATAAIAKMASAPTTMPFQFRLVDRGLTAGEGLAAGQEVVGAASPQCGTRRVDVWLTSSTEARISGAPERVVSTVRTFS
jgi:hypothetical protein